MEHRIKVDMRKLCLSRRGSVLRLLLVYTGVVQACPVSVQPYENVNKASFSIFHYLSTGRQTAKLN